MNGAGPARFGPASWGSLVAVALAVVAAGVGAVWPHVYRDDGIIRDGWFPNDLVTLGVAAPTLVAARARALRGSRGAELVWLGALHYLVYDAAFYLLGATLNALFPVYAATVVAAFWSLVHLAARIDARAQAAAAGPQRGVAAWMSFMALGLTAIWTIKWCTVLLHPSPAPRFDETPEFVRLVAAMDLSMMVGFFAPGAWWLWRGRPWGYVIGVALNVSAALYDLVLLGGSFVQHRAGIPGAGPMMGLWGFLALGCGLSAARLLRAAKPSV